MRGSLLIVAAALVQLTVAQTFTTCDPLNKTCPADKALGKTITVDFTKGASSEFNLAGGTTLTYDSTNGAKFSINKETDAPTITSNWYIMFGKVDVVLKAAPGQGIVSSFVMESDDLDEIDWEWLGGNTAQAETNFFGKGDLGSYNRATYVPVSSPEDSFHTYTVDWTAQAVKWSIDGTLVRTLAYDDPLTNGGQNYPQTPMQIKMGNWVGGSSTAPQGTVQWAGGLADFTKVPFNMYVQSVTVQDYSTGGSEYVYSDMSGSWQSIKTVSGSSAGSSDSSSSSSSSSPSSSSSSSSSPSSSSGSPSSGSTSATASSTASGSSTTTSSTSASTTSTTFSIVTTAPVASGAGLGAGAVTASVSSNSGVATTSPTVSATTTAAAASSKPSGNAGATVKGSSSYALAVFALGLSYLVM